MGDLSMTAASPPVIHSASFSESNPLQVSTQNWAAADEATRDLIRMVHPTSLSEDRRRKVVHYIQKLIRTRLGFEVFPYGSVPLKTYLPDGDIDLTLFGGANNEENLVDDIRLILEEEGKNTSSEIVVKDVQIVRAEVKLVKCIVQDIVVDVSFNQIGGLCTLCFLEQVDRLIGKDHLFKRSIILIKAWCYYESRILGAHHGLISTYALETLVLYIFHFFHSTLDGPLTVLYKFLDYFSKFDWDTYCISLHGPVRLSSMPDVVVEMPEDSDRDLLLPNEFLSSCVSMFSVPFTSGDKTLRTFQCKNLNIIDPLKEINNLGRSVSKGNFYRIRSAFSYGARKLAQILLQPEPFIAIELHKFFQNTMARHGGEQRSDVQVFELSLFCKRPVSGGRMSETVFPKKDHPYEFDGLYFTGGFQSTSGTFSQDIAQEMENTLSNMRNMEQHCNSALKVQTALPDGDQPSRPHTQDSSFLEDSNSINISTLGSLKISPESSSRQTQVLKDTVTAAEPHLYFSKSKTHSCNVGDTNQDSDTCDNFGQNPSFLTSSGAGGSRALVTGSVEEKPLADREALALRPPNTVFSSSMSSSTLGHLTHGDMEPNSGRGVETPESLQLSDLSGNYDGYLRWLQFGRWCYEYGLSVHSLQSPPLPTGPMYLNSSLWDGVVPVSHFKQTGFSPRHLNGFYPNPAVYSMRPVLLPGVAFGWEEPPKPKGTGTYIPNSNQPPHAYRSSTVKGRSQVPSRSPRSNGRHTTFEPIPNMIDRRSYESPQPQFPVENSSFENHLVFPSHGSGGFPNMANGSGIQLEAVVEYEVVEHGSESRQQRPLAVSSSPISVPSSREQDRISLSSSYHLRDEGDFPPLSGVERLSVI